MKELKKQVIYEWLKTAWYMLVVIAACIVLMFSTAGQAMDSILIVITMFNVAFAYDSFKTAAEISACVKNNDE